METSSRPTLSARAQALSILLWRLEADGAAQMRTPFPLTHARLACRLARAAALAAFEKRFGRRWPDDHHHATPGRDSEFWMALDMDDDGAIDHLVYRVDHGMAPDVAEAMRMPLSLFLAHGPVWRLEPVSPQANDMRALLGPARGWATMTPYVTPGDCFDDDGKKSAGRYRNRRSPAEQLRAELAKIVAPPVVELGFCGARLCDGRRLDASVFRAREEDGARLPAHKRPPRLGEWGFARIAFAEPVTALPPLGFGAHDGLGIFMPVG